jgi:uncharacterized membrane protein YphA (DoxX/SURF4 family)
VNVVLWIVAILLALLFLGAGATKLIQPKQKIAANPNMAWAQDFSPGLLKLIGLLEVLAAVGLILPGALGVATVLVPLAATGLVLMMIGAIVVHGRRGEFPPVGMNVTLLILALFVAIFRFGPNAF